MTIQMPKKNAGDRILEKFGKKRAVFIPDPQQIGLGPHVHMTARRESFLRALFRPAGAPLKEGWSLTLYE